MSIWQAQLVGGHPALDFLNSVSHWTIPATREYLGEPGDALAYGVATGILSEGEAAELGPRLGDAALRELHAFRARLQRVVSALASGNAAPADDLARLSADHSAAIAASALREADGRLAIEVTQDAASATVLRHRVVLQAIELLTSAEMSKVKSCPACGWYFLDTSRNHSRRWCSMAVCGNSEKARRYYRKT